jgi:hypothetical protein
VSYGDVALTVGKAWNISMTLEQGQDRFERLPDGTEQMNY